MAGKEERKKIRVERFLAESGSGCTGICTFSSVGNMASKRFIFAAASYGKSF